jgi:hypothetical protein
MPTKVAMRRGKARRKARLVYGHTSENGAGVGHLAWRFDGNAIWIASSYLATGLPIGRCIVLNEYEASTGTKNMPCRGHPALEPSMHNVDLPTNWLFREEGL